MLFVSARHALALLTLGCLTSGCRCANDAPRPDAGAPAPSQDAGTRIRAPEEVAPFGRASDGRETDVPIAWIYLLTDPSPTGAAPYAVVGARLPCGYAPRYVTADRGDFEIGLRVRAKWVGQGAPPATDPAPCEGAAATVQLVSLSVLRLGLWRIFDVSSRGADGGAGLSVHQRVVADDATIAPPVARWSRGCASDDECAGAGGVCVRVADASVCAPQQDPWLSIDQPCAGGTVATEVSAAGRRWRACMPSCGSACPASHRCVGEGASAVCVPTGRR